jgi:hypothetical protein
MRLSQQRIVNVVGDVIEDRVVERKVLAVPELVASHIMARGDDFRR